MYILYICINIYTYKHVCDYACMYVLYPQNSTGTRPGSSLDMAPALGVGAPGIPTSPARRNLICGAPQVGAHGVSG